MNSVNSEDIIGILAWALCEVNVIFRFRKDNRITLLEDRRFSAMQEGAGEASWGRTLEIPVEIRYNQRNMLYCGNSDTDKSVRQEEAEIGGKKTGGKDT